MNDGKYTSGHAQKGTKVVTGSSSAVKAGTDCCPSCDTPKGKGKMPSC
jgi:hypothetical protein